MIRRLCLILVLGFLLASTGWSQHFPVYSQYMLNGLAINPAYAGSREVLSATFMYREQWVGIEGAPGMVSLAAHMPFRKQRVALGVLVSNESIGLENNTSIYGNYAYRIQMGSGKLAFGLKAGFNLAKEQISRVTLHDPTSDNAFNDLKETVFMPNFGFGVYYSNSTYFAGLSLPTILSYQSGGQAATGLRTYNLLITGGYLYKVSEQFKIKPSSLVKYKYASAPQFDLNMNLIFFKDDILWVGGSYRNKESIVSLIEIQVSRTFRLGYSYDYSIGPLSKYNSGSHEIMLRWEWRDKVNTLNPLYF